MTVYDAGWENHSQIYSDINFWYGKFKFDVRSLRRVYNTAKNCECKKTLHRFYIRFIWTLQLLCKMYVKITHQNQITCVRGNEDKHGYIWRIDNDRRACFVFVWNACDGRWACQDFRW